jgi:hypothetical protein
MADEPSSEALIERGLDLRQERRDVEALALFEQAQALSPTPRGQAQVALAEQALGRWALAERNLVTALDARGDAWIGSRRAILEQALAVIRSHLGDVEIVGVSVGDVYVDGVPMRDRDARSHLRLEAGKRILEVHAGGMYRVSRTVEVRAGETVRIELEQHPLLADAPSARLTPPTTEPGVTAVAEPPHAQRTIGWVLLGGSGLLAAAGLSGLVLRDVSAIDFNGRASCTGTPNAALSSTCRGYLDNGSLGQTLAIAGFVGGGVLAGTSIALIVTAPKGPSKPVVALASRCTPLGGGVFCAVGGSF